MLPLITVQDALSGPSARKRGPIGSIDKLVRYPRLIPDNIDTAAYHRGLRVKPHAANQIVTRFVMLPKGSDDELSEWAGIPLNGTAVAWS